MTSNDKTAVVALAGAGVVALSTLLGYVLLVPETPVPLSVPQQATAPVQPAEVPVVPPVQPTPTRAAVQPTPVPATVQTPKAPEAPALRPAPPPAPVIFERTIIPTDAAHTTTPSALVLAPTLLALQNYDLSAATFLPWKNYLLGDPKNRLWQQIPWRTTLWDGIVDANEQDLPILLEIHGGNAVGRC